MDLALTENAYNVKWREPFAKVASPLPTDVYFTFTLIFSFFFFFLLTRFYLYFRVLVY